MSNTSLSNRRRFLSQTTQLTAGAALAGNPLWSMGQDSGARPRQDPRVTPILPQNRVPLSFIIDDSTCLVNLAHFAIPQFAQVFPDRYRQPWRELPREIPDAFVEKFIGWCRDHGVKGKYSVVPYPACVGWMDRDLPGWSRQELQASLRLVRDEVTKDWDIHPEMVSHTWVIDTKTGRPYQEKSEYFMENWRWTDGKSVDQLTGYLAYALQILKNVDLPCEGITTPGGFGNRVLPQLSQATLQSVRSVYGAEIPHYFRHLYTDERSVAPRVEYAAGLETADPECVVSIIGCTGDWFGGWDGLTPGNVDRFITEDLEGGRLPEVIDRGEPAIMVCHWPGIYYNGEELGFNIFKEAVRRVHARNDNLIWMKLSELSRYWAAKELTSIEVDANGATLLAPFACPKFTIAIDVPNIREVGAQNPTDAIPFLPIDDWKRLDHANFATEDTRTLVCFDLPKGRTRLTWR